MTSFRNFNIINITLNDSHTKDFNKSGFQYFLNIRTKIQITFQDLAIFAVDRVPLLIQLAHITALDLVKYLFNFMLKAVF